MRRSTKYGAVLALGVAVAAVLALTTGQMGGERAERGGPTPDAGNPAESQGAGMRVVVDPETGALIQDSADLPADDEGFARDRLRTYSRDLIQQPLPQGGFMVDLEDRFSSSMVATIDPLTDEVHIDCGPTSEDEGGEGEHEH